MRAWTYRGSHALVSTVDSWFGDEPFDQRGKVSGYVRVNTLWEEGQGTKANARFRLRAGLPNLRRSAYAFVGQDNEREEIIDQPEAFRREQLLLRESRSGDQSFFAGLGYALKDDIDLRLGVRGGFNLYAQARYRTQWMLSPRDAVYFRESLFWSVDDSFGSTTALDYEHALSPTLVLRWANVGTVTRRSDGFEWQSSVGFFKDYTGLRTASVEALVQGRTGSVDVSNYGIRSAWRQPLYKDWLFGKLTVGHFWPRDKVEDNRRDAWAVDFGLEMHF
ncbi:hypothetical protein D8I35_14095 [Corticibacter populi]|uniref:Alginate export domain-containing protein n=1 Tax=Corticibacter populi TaxID=1550736 RepID=A0A3M6QPT1_9BURK|nr:hypothetical protein D8I35_14095 [Corticibacter populi]